MYATILGRPETDSVLLESFAANQLPSPIEIESIRLLESDLPVEWSIGEQGLSLSADRSKTDPMAVTFKIETKQ
ncbi:hypothetical protein H5P27_18085 [Pelagicoccus albus]|uniref:Uncharacterized protein n=1 Tax=Pelagicoccus albus TaxID=415222 RepID=A0A7X1E9K8_9BACT|nr:hypothetical protein [Pelagicoccus albus]